MAFIYVADKRAAIDPETGEMISDGVTSYDSNVIFPMMYTKGNLKFEFGIVPITKKVKMRIRGEEVEANRDIAFYVDMSTVQFGISMALRKLGRSQLSATEQSALLKSIKDGLIVKATRGGNTLGEFLEEIPEFQVDFIRSLKELDRILPKN